MQPSSDSSPTPPAPPPGNSSVVLVAQNNRPNRSKLPFLIISVLILIVGISTSLYLVIKNRNLLPGKALSTGVFTNTQPDPYCSIDTGTCTLPDSATTLIILKAVCDGSQTSCPHTGGSNQSADHSQLETSRETSVTNYINNDGVNVTTPCGRTVQIDVKTDTPACRSDIFSCGESTSYLVWYSGDCQSTTPTVTVSPEPSVTPSPSPSISPEPTPPPLRTNVSCNSACGATDLCEGGLVCYAQSGTCRKENNITDPTCGNVGPTNVGSSNPPAPTPTPIAPILSTPLPTPTPIAQLPQSGSSDGTWFIGLGGLLLLGTGALLLL